MDDTIYRQAAIDAMCAACWDWCDEGVCKKVSAIQKLPSAQPELPPYIVEIESEYRKAVNNPYIKKPLAKALYEVWKKHDRDDAERKEE